jgi:hypothetical protein
MAPSPCPHCGRAQDDETCRERFDLLLSLEFTDPAYGAVHHLTVPAYMLQHDGYSADAWPAARGLLRDFLEGGGMRPEDARRQPPQGIGSVTQGPRFQPARRVAWRRTIGDVRTDDPDAYVADVKAWAYAIIADTQGISR